MACRNCSKTMQRVNSGLPRVWWCPFCGSLLSEATDETGRGLDGVIDDFERPKIVELAKAFLDNTSVSNRRSLREAFPPEEREDNINMVGFANTILGGHPKG